MAITVEAAGQVLPALVRQVVDDGLPVEIRSAQGDAVLLSLADYEALQDLRGSANGGRLAEALRECRRLEGDRR
ncbi:MAG TPA: type II toxin-antitoxin system prevent-host-death family antitoxin [Acidimicrobiales bacterium]|nr:type II toxin-antitoxin system prevent-host-death family antitoxin [Acidimicrobiales bacterium]